MMKHRNIRPRAALFIGAAFLATPAFAQDMPTVTPPPIATAPAPAPQTAPERVIQMQPQAPVVQAVPEVPKPQTPPAAEARASAPAPARQTRTVTRTRTAETRSVQTRATAPAAPAVATPAAPVASQPAAPSVIEAPGPVANVPTAVEPAPATLSQPEATPVDATQSTQTTSQSSTLPWILGAIALAIAAIAAFMLMRRRDPEFVEEVRREPVLTPVAEPVIEPVVADTPVVVAPVAAAPLIERKPEPKFTGYVVGAPVPEPEVREAQALVATAEDVSVQEPEQDDLAGVADGTAPVARRPWLELGMRPVRAGTDKDDAIVDIELTVGNSGDTIAKDVRISTFMLAEATSDAQIESLLIEHRDDNNVAPVTIEPGEGTRVDAHLAVPKGDLGRTFNPVVVAEARYTLPDGRQGRTSAAFKIGCPSEGGMRPLAATRPFLTETVEAELYGTPEHA